MDEHQVPHVVLPGRNESLAIEQLDLDLDLLMHLDRGLRHFEHDLISIDHQDLDLQGRVVV